MTKSTFKYSSCYIYFTFRLIVNYVFKQEREDGNSAGVSSGTGRVRGNSTVWVNQVFERACDGCYLCVGISEAVVSSVNGLIIHQGRSCCIIR